MNKGPSGWAALFRDPPPVWEVSAQPTEGGINRQVAATRIDNPKTPPTDRFAIASPTGRGFQAGAARLSVMLIRPPPGISPDDPGRMRSTPWKARRAGPDSRQTSPDDSFSDRVGSLRAVPPMRNTAVSPSEIDST